MSFFELYRGVTTGLLGALFFGTGNVIYRLASEDMDITLMNLIRSLQGFLFFIIITVILRDFSTILAQSGYIILMLALSALFNIVIGDLFYFYSQHYIGVSKAFPITNLTPFLTLFLAAFLLDEPLTSRIFMGVFFVVVGVYLVSKPSKSENETQNVLDRKKIQLGFVFAFLSALCWTGGTLTLRIALSSDLGVMPASSVRYFFSILFVGLVSTKTGSLGKIRKYNQQTLRIVIIATVFNILIGSMLWADSLKHIGASKGATIAATAPLFAMPVAIVLLGEKFSWKIIFGTVLTIFGVWLVV